MTLRIRQVLEETGYDISGRLREEDFVEVALGDQDTKLYIVQARALEGRAWEGGTVGAQGTQFYVVQARRAAGGPGRGGGSRVLRGGGPAGGCCARASRPPG